MENLLKAYDRHMFILFGLRLEECRQDDQGPAKSQCTNAGKTITTQELEILGLSFDAITKVLVSSVNRSET